MDAAVHAEPFDRLTLTQLYGILRLRSDVFVVEQECVYADLDGRDLEPGTLHLWLEENAVVVSALRVLDDGEVHRIGRVCTHPWFRNRGLAGRLMDHVTATVAPPLFLGAQVHLQRWYERFGFVACGDIWDENGIAHLPMRRDA